MWMFEKLLTNENLHKESIMAAPVLAQVKKPLSKNHDDNLTLNSETSSFKMIITSHRKTGTSSWSEIKFNYSMVIWVKIHLRRKTDFRHQKIDCTAQERKSCFGGRRFWLKRKSQLFLYLSSPPLLLLFSFCAKWAAYPVPSSHSDSPLRT